MGSVRDTSKAMWPERHNKHSIKECISQPPPWFCSRGTGRFEMLNHTSNQGKHLFWICSSLFSIFTLWLALWLSPYLKHPALPLFPPLGFPLVSGGGLPGRGWARTGPRGCVRKCVSLLKYWKGVWREGQCELWVMEGSLWWGCWNPQTSMTFPACLIVVDQHRLNHTVDSLVEQVE